MAQTSRYLTVVVPVEFGPFAKGYWADKLDTQGTTGDSSPGRTDRKRISTQKRNCGTKTCAEAHRADLLGTWGTWSSQLGP